MTPVGPTVNDQGQVIGETVDASDSHMYLSSSDLKVLNSIQFTEEAFGEKTGFEPNVASLVPVSLINAVLDSPKLKS